MPTLSERDRLILETAFLQANASATQIAKQLGMRAETVRRTIESLIEKGIFRRRMPCVDVGALGFQEYTVLVQGWPGRSGENSRVLKELIDSDRVGFAAEVGGKYEYEFWIYVRRHAELLDFFDELSSRLKINLQCDSLAVTHSYELSGLSMVKHRKAGAVIKAPPRPVRAAVDEVDHQILATLAQGSFDSVKIIARELSLPASDRDLPH